MPIPKQGQRWIRTTDPVLLYVQIVRIAGPVQDGKVPVQTERVSGKLGKRRLVPLSRFDDGATHFRLYKEG